MNARKVAVGSYALRQETGVELGQGIVHEGRRKVEHSTGTVRILLDGLGGTKVCQDQNSMQNLALEMVVLWQR